MTFVSGASAQAPLGLASGDCDVSEAALAGAEASPEEEEDSALYDEQAVRPTATTALAPMMARVERMVVLSWGGRGAPGCAHRCCAGEPSARCGNLAALRGTSLERGTPARSGERDVTP